MSEKREITTDTVRQSIRTMRSCLSQLPDSKEKSELDQEIGFLTTVLQRYSGATTALGSTSEPWQAEIVRQPRLPSVFQATPTFIIGSRRSGTTLLSWLLDSHPNLACGPETNICHAILESKVTEQHLMIAGAYEGVGRLQETMGEFLLRFGKLIDELLSDHARRHGKQRWVDKELFIHKSLDLVDRAFDYRAQYVYIIRHGLDAALSAAEYSTRPQVEPSSLNLRNRTLEWVESHEATMDFVERNAERAHLVRFEELLDHPERIARELFDFLGEPWVDDIFTRMQTQEHTPFFRTAGDAKIHLTGGRIDRQRRDRWLDLPPVLLAQLGRIANPTLIRLGYDPVAQ